MNTLDQYKNFPSSRYMGSKNKIIKDLHEVFKKHSFNSALDLFSGSSSVSYLLKAMGKKVISNDYMSFASNISNAIISNNKTKLKIVLAHYEHTLGSKTPFWFSLNFTVLY